MKTLRRPGLRPRPRWESLQRPQVPLLFQEGGWLPITKNPILAISPQRASDFGPLDRNFLRLGREKNTGYDPCSLDEFVQRVRASAFVSVKRYELTYWPRQSPSIGRERSVPRYELTYWPRHLGSGSVVYPES